MRFSVLLGFAVRWGVLGPCGVALRGTWGSTVLCKEYHVIAMLSYRRGLLS